MAKTTNSPRVSETKLLSAPHCKTLFQIKNDILQENIYCPAEKAVLLASFAIQSKFGDYVEGTTEPGYLANEKLLPPKVLSQHKLSIEEWQDKVRAWMGKKVFDSGVTSNIYLNSLSRCLDLQQLVYSMSELF